jgi:putative hemolysin
VEIDPVIVVELLLFLVLLALSGFFSGSETAFFSLNQSQLEQMKNDRNPILERIKLLLNEPRRLIVTILIGNELVNVSASVISASLVIQLMGGEDKWWVNIFIMLPILLLFGEITPKTIALKSNVLFATKVTPFLEMFATAISPLRVVIRFVADGLTTLLIGKERSRGNIVTEDMVRTLVDHAAGLGALDSTEQKFINNIFDFGNQTVRELMTLRSNFIAFSIDTPAIEILDKVKETSFTRVPIYRNHKDAVVGILHIRDLMDPNIDINTLNAKSLRLLLRKPLLVPASKSVTDLFFMLRKRKSSFALVLDEFGGIIGLVTMDDLLGTIFGSLTPNLYTTEAQEVDADGKQLITIKGSMPIYSFNRKMDAEIPTDMAETMGGWLMHSFGELPSEGESIPFEGWEFVATKVVNNRIVKIDCQQEIANHSAADKTDNSQELEQQN